jgi:fumarylacetoacetase
MSNSIRINSTHDPELRSSVESANVPGCDFPIQNLPFGVFSSVSQALLPRPGVRIGDRILDLTESAQRGLLDQIDPDTRHACTQAALNSLMALGKSRWSKLRQHLSNLLREDNPARESLPLVRIADATMHLPAIVGDYTDFYASIFHATNVGRMFRPDNPLFPNYKYLPVGYHGRASSVVVSGTDVICPHGQIIETDAASPVYVASRALDFELEAGFFIGPGNGLGNPVRIEDAQDHVFGLCLVNDWSARDIQRWEYQPLGPFLSKSFMTSVSPWLVTMEALEPFRIPAFKRDESDPKPLPHLFSELDQEQGGMGLNVEALIQSERMRDEGIEPMLLSRGDFTTMYWTIAQMVTHHTSNGCNLRPGDLLASGTISGSHPESCGCLLELTQAGSHPVKLPNGEERKYLADGDELILQGYCERAGTRRIGLGECRGRIVARTF